MVLKYQLVLEDLDVLISVRSDEDLKHRLDEYDYLESEGKLQCFLFPSNPILIKAQPFSSNPQQIPSKSSNVILKLSMALSGLAPLPM
ncbi:octicosapeptide/Phox/Bem1p domain-containing family protein [Cucumis melo var. makuwa]|uniref:Octicosapeptide/Phox/Bem1p domain-containing family protein n=1 Tax=Cucumis melo var. makuwa TaxID=1194695 RepID=A0A5A7U0M3_CUCMM|nr:octicosapeptide/Phox/Bem1p domain-containing family protein [Cucumis melo var. makuwa]